MDWLSDLSWVPNGAVVLISCTSGAGGTKDKAPVATAAASSAPAEGVKAASGSGSGKHDGGETSAAPPEADGEGERQTEEDDEEALALAALGRIRETYRARARERQSGAAGRARDGDVSDEQAGKRMMDKRREVESTAQSRQASYFCKLFLSSVFLLGVQHFFVVDFFSSGSSTSFCFPVAVAVVRSCCHAIFLNRCFRMSPENLASSVVSSAPSSVVTKYVGVRIS